MSFFKYATGLFSLKKLLPVYLKFAFHFGCFFVLLHCRKKNLHMKPNIFKSASQNGLLIGVLLSLKFLLSTQDNIILSSFAIVISILIIVAMYLMTKRFRDKDCEGFISYGISFRYILQIYFFGAIISSLVILIYTKFININYFDQYMNSALKMYDSMHIPLDDNSYKMLESLFKPSSYAILNLTFSIVIGAFWGVILAAFIKKEKNIFE